MRIGGNRVMQFMLKNSQIHVNILIIVNILLAGVAFLKDILLARYFGTSYHADSLYLAFFLPDTVGNSLLASAIGVACIPLFAKKNKDEPHSEQTVIIALTILISLCFILILLPSAKWLFTHFSHEMFIDEQKLTFNYFLILLPIVIFSPVAAIAASILQVHGKFAKPAFMPVIFNFVLLISIIICLTANYPLSIGGYIYSSSLLISTVVISFLTWFFVFKLRGIDFKWLLHPIILYRSNKEELHLFLKLFTPYFLILLCQQFIFLFERYCASSLEIGTISGLTYAYRISQFPIWVFIAAINTVFLPKISKLKNDVNKTKLINELNKTLIQVVFISSFISILFFIFGEKLISILFLKGAFGQQSLAITSDIFNGYSLSILGQSVFLFCLRYFIASGKMIIPLMTCVIGCLFHILFIFLLVSQMGAKGIGYAAAIGYSFTGTILLIYLYSDISRWNKKVVESDNE